MRSPIIRDALGVGVATGAYGLAFGAVSTAAGLSIGQTCALSLFMFTGASQFALVGLAGSPATAAGTAVLLGAPQRAVRLAAGVVAPRRAGSAGCSRAHLVLDESTAMAVAQDDEADARLAFWATGASIFVLWNIATLVGALGANALSDPKVLGLDAAAPAAFLALLVPKLRTTESRVVALVAAAVAVALTPVVPAGVPVLCAALVALFAGLRHVA